MKLTEHTGFWIMVGIILWLVIGFGVYYFYFNDSDSPNNINDIPDADTTCIELGCSEQTAFVGSVNSDKYYECDCRFAKTVNPENIVCFQSERVAEIKGYVKSDC